MKRTDRREDLLSKLALLALVLSLLWLATGCSSGSETIAVAPVLEPTAVIVTATSEIVATPEPVEMVIAAEPDTCTDCHTDKDLLIDTADPVEEVVNENEGEG